MDERIRIKTPLTPKVIKSLNAGDMVYLSGIIYTGRDAAHKRMVEMIDQNKNLPFEFEGQVIYYAGPTPTPKHERGRKPVIGSIGPTTSGRMDKYSPVLMEKGLVAMIGKGSRNQTTADAIILHCGIYFSAIGGAAALISKCVKSAEVIAFEDLGTEAIRRLSVEDFPLIVGIDCFGKSIYN